MVTPRGIIISFLVFVLQAGAGQLSGTISDSSNNPVPNVYVVLIGQGPTVYGDSTFSDSTGAYSLPGFPVGSYRLQLSRNGYASIDTALLLSDAAQVINFRLKKIRGVQHSGNVSGVWLASDNPHVIIGNVTVVDSLTIAPGCTVETLAGNILYFFADANLKIGQLGSSRTLLSMLTLMSNSKGTQNISIANTSIMGGNTFLRGNRILFDSVTCNPSISADGADCNQFIMRNSNFQGTLQYVPFARTFAPSFWFGITSAKTSISNSFFYDLPLETDNCDSLSVSYCCFDSYSVLSIIHLTSYIRISHSDLNTLSLYQIGDFTIADCIIDSVRFSPMPSQTYNSPFNHCIITNLVQNPVFGLVQPIQVNNNKDSCDLWYNIKADPMFASPPVLKSGSKAISAAGDGTNIGYYQGLPVSSKHDWKRNDGRNMQSRLPFLRRGSGILTFIKSENAVISGYSLAGKNVTVEAANGNLIRRSGIVIVKVNENGKTWYSKTVLVR